MTTASELQTAAVTDLGNGNVVAAFDKLKRALAVAQLESEWSVALACAKALQGMIATFGSTTKQSGNVQTRLEWSGESLTSIVDRLQTQVNLSAFSQFGTYEIPIQYVRPEAES